MASNGTYFWYMGSGASPSYQDSFDQFDIQYPSNVLLKVNGTVVFNHTGDMTGSNNSIDLNAGDVLTTCYQSTPTCNFRFSTDTFGILETKGLTVTYNNSNIAVVSFISPAQITQSTSTYFDTSILMENTGSYNATGCMFETVASGTPNYNSSLSYPSFDIPSGTNKSVILTVTGVVEDSEPDERLRFYCIGTADSQTVYSDYIDFDITYTPPVDTGGGGGGSTIVIDETNRSVIIDYGILYYDRTIWWTPYNFSDYYLIKNVGNKDFSGLIGITGDASDYLDAYVCDLKKQNCQKNVEMASGQSKLMLISGDIDSFGVSSEGIIALKGSDGNFELKARISRPPAYGIQRSIMQRLGVGEQAALIIAYSTIGLIVLLTFYYLASYGIGL
jgi:hypothetical protein